MNARALTLMYRPRAAVAEQMGRVPTKQAQTLPPVSRVDGHGLAEETPTLFLTSERENHERGFALPSDVCGPT